MKDSTSHLTSELEKICTHFGILIDCELQCIVQRDEMAAGKSIEDLYIERNGGVHVAGVC